MPQAGKIVAIMLAGGSGTRMADSTDDKVLATIRGKTAFRYALDAFVASESIHSFVVVYRDPEQKQRIAAEIPQTLANPVLWTKGGSERQLSVSNGLEACPEDTSAVLIHDCARPLVSPAAIREAARIAGKGQVATVARRVTDTIKVAETANKGAILSSLDRSKLWAMETPQAFPYSLIRDGYRAVLERNIAITDDLSAIEGEGIPTTFIDNGHPNPKITTPNDLAYIEFFLQHA